MSELQTGARRCVPGCRLSWAVSNPVTCSRKKALERHLLGEEGSGNQDAVLL